MLQAGMVRVMDGITAVRATAAGAMVVANNPDRTTDGVNLAARVMDVGRAEINAGMPAMVVATATISAGKGRFSP